MQPRTCSGYRTRGTRKPDCDSVPGLNALSNKPDPRGANLMSVFSRLSEIIASNLSALLDRAEDPELLLRQFIYEMEEGFGIAKRHAATVIATERRLGRELEWNRDQAEV